ncbi:MULTISPECIES: hypothetical protein [Xenorhabdus]|uniref:hypothetical protein n=1 Tax=Xenorhabdus TaxID=626 RepID=UPI0006467E21|nr:hypothetical protein [Xenorhabdus indica]
MFYAPKDLNDLWCPQILEILNADEDADLLKAFQNEIFDSRGVRLVDLTGQEEFELADKYKKLAVLAEQEGFWKYLSNLIPGVS